MLGEEDHSQWEVMKPGMTRMNIPWWTSDMELKFILTAVEMVVNDGWKLLPMYSFDRSTGNESTYLRLCGYVWTKDYTRIKTIFIFPIVSFR